MRKAVLGTIITLIVLSAAFMIERSYRLNRNVPTSNAGKILPGTLVLKDLQTSKDVTLDRFAGKVVLINFWASWCAACMAEMPSIQKLYELYKDSGFVVVGVNVDENPEKVVPGIVSKLGLTFQNYTDVDGKLSETYGVVAIPYSIVTGRKLNIVWAESGERDWASPKVVEEIKKLVEEKI